MKLLKTSIIALLLATAFASCKKDNDVTPSNNGSNHTNLDHSMPGKWVGKYGFDNENPSTYYCFVLNANGTFTEWNSLSDSIGEGTWSNTGIHFTATSHFYPPFISTFKLNAILDTVNMKVTGTWGYSPSTTDGGNFYLVKQ